MTRIELPSKERLRHLFDYHPDGYLVRRVPVSNQVAGTVLGCPAGGKGYWSGMVDSVSYRVHRLIFQWHHGHCPDMLDHIDEDKGNNRVGNLRGITNGHNCRRKKHGYVRVTPSGRWQGVIKVGGRPLHVGMFDTEADAKEACLSEYDARGMRHD